MGILFFKANWVIGDDGVVRRVNSTSGSSTELVHAPVNNEALRNIMNMVYLGEQTPIRLTGEDSVEETQSYLQQQIPTLCQTLQPQSPNDGTRPDPNVLAFREALTLERHRTAEALGLMTKKKVEEDSRTTPVECADTNLEAAIAKKVRTHAGPIRRSAAHAEQLKQYGEQQKGRIRAVCEALFNCIFGPLTRQCARHDSLPTSLSFIPVKKVDDLPSGVFCKNTTRDLMEEITQEQQAMCGDIIVSDVVYNLPRAGSRSGNRAGVAVLSGNVCFPNGTTQNIYDFMNNLNVQDLMRHQLSQYFDSGVTFKNTEKRTSATRGHATLNPNESLMLNLSWAGKQ